MRLIAIMLVSLLALTTSPVAPASNECETNTNAARVCVAVPVTSPHPAIPVPPTTVYVIVAGNICQGNPTSDGCTGVVFQESNNCPGLQRKATTACGGKPADRKLLA